MEKKELKAICYGEVLWDIFPDEERIGGAPLNVASRLSATGISTGIISRIGEDQKGMNVLEYLEQAGVKTDFIQKDPVLPTGKVLVELSKSGSASYEIAYPAAWDKIGFDKNTETAVKEANAFIFGSLVCRDEVSRNTLFSLINLAQYKIFDVNLRPPHYSIDTLKFLMKKADFIKFNDEELFEISAAFGSPFKSLEQNLMYLHKHTGTPSICVTKGSHGAVLLRAGKLFYNSGYQITVKDTVGAGDSFLASLISKLLKEKDPQRALDYACAVGAMVAGREGANPVLKQDEILQFMFPNHQQDWLT